MLWNVEMWRAPGEKSTLLQKSKRIWLLKKLEKRGISSIREKGSLVKKKKLRDKTERQIQNLNNCKIQRHNWQFLELFQNKTKTKPKPLIVVQENAGCGFADER